MTRFIHYERASLQYCLFPFHLQRSFWAVLAALLLTFATFGQASQKSSSIVIHDTTSAANGGENATAGLRSQFESALARDKPCVETMDDQDLRDALQAERERALLEGSDSTEALKAIGERLGSNMVMNVQAMPGPGGTTVYSAFVLDTTKGRTVARSMGSESEVADSLVKQLGSYLADNCKAHWTGTVTYVATFNETKTTDDQGAAHAVRRNTKRTNTTITNAVTTIKVRLLPPEAGSDAAGVGSPRANVMHRNQFTGTKRSVTTGEVRCREPGKNPYFTGFSEEYAETTTRIGQGTDTRPVAIAVNSDGTYSVRVSAPGGESIGKFETTRNETGCGNAPAPTIEVIEMPPSNFDPTSFEAYGKVDPKNKDQISGTQTSPDGRTKITFNLRLARPKGK